MPNTYWVLPARLLAGEHPGGATTAFTRERLQRLLQAGVGCFIDLTQPDEVVPYDALLPAGIDYLRKPLPDHGLPAQPAQMHDILASVRRALREGRVIYLHCRGGIGRTGLVVGCFLAEGGLSGEEALGELNRLWQQSARAVAWPFVPETVAQIDYVRRWTPAAEPSGDPLFEPKTLAVAHGLRERFQGTLLGLAAGDAVAAATQYARPGRFVPVGDMLGGGPFDLPRGGWSDDTAMALCLAESLLECGGFDARDQVERYRRWQQDGHLSASGQCIGITAATVRALAVARWRHRPFAGAHDPGTADAEPLSRVAPVAMYFFAESGAAAEHAAEAARTTCQAPLALAACRALAETLLAALAGQPKAVILARSQAAAKPLERFGAGAAAADSAPALLAAAIDTFGRTHTFRDAVLAAANLGGNCDVVAAVCGALAGAHYGARAIPTSWRSSLMREPLIEQFAERLLERAIRQPRA